jgi:hypothetical protein
MDKKIIHDFFLWLAMIGDVFFIVWITINGIDEGFSGTAPEIASYLGLSALLILNIAILWQKRK